MARVEARVRIEASLAETWAHYFEPRAWPSWVEGFGSVEEADGYPHRGGTLRWHSVPAGRGVVVETVLENEPRRLHRIAFEDRHAQGELRSELEMRGSGVLMTQVMDYRLVGRRGPLAWLTDRLFVRPQMQRSLQRSLDRFRVEVEAQADTAPQRPDR